MAPTRPAQNGPTPKSAPTTQNNGIKKASKPREQQLYVVSRETNDPEGVHDCREIVGTFKTLAAANAAAREDLIKGWGRDYFDAYEASEVNGMVHVVAACPDGEEMVVLVEKTELKKSGVAKKAAGENLAVGAPEEITVYHVTRHTIDYHHDPEGGMQDSVIKGTFLSLAKANEAARRDLLDEWDSDFFEEYEETVHNGMVTIKTNCPEGEEMNVYVEKGKLFTDGVHLEGLGEVEEELEESEGESDY